MDRTLRTSEKNRNAVSAKLQALAKWSSEGALKGTAVAMSSRYVSEKTNAINSCSMDPGMMSTMKPTKKSFFHASSSSHQKKLVS